MNSEEMIKDEEFANLVKIDLFLSDISSDYQRGFNEKHIREIDWKKVPLELQEALNRLTHSLKNVLDVSEKLIREKAEVLKNK
jgi:hypothetical protein